MERNLLLSLKEKIIYTHDTQTDDRSRIVLVANNMILHLHPTSVPAPALRFTYTWGLGGISALLAAILGLTGLLLMFRYDARTDYAYRSIQQLETQVMFGAFVRALHHWSANFLVLTTFLHFLRVFFTGSYKQGRSMNWLIGLTLLVLVLASNFTGYLLPWDQMAYWAITVSTNLLDYIPLVGTWISRFLLGGAIVGQPALSNFYAFHVVLLPMLGVSAMAYHFWKVRKNGGISQPIHKEKERTERLTTLPHLINRELTAASVVLAGITVWAMLQPAPLGSIANPLNSPNPAKAAWYFMGFQELLLHMHPLAAIVLVTIVLAGLLFLPTWDREERQIGLYFRSATGRKAALVGSILAVELVTALVIADEYWWDLPAWLPAWPAALTGGLIPLVVCLVVLVGVYILVRRVISYQGCQANHSEALIGLFVFIMTCLVILTMIGVYFRGENMALVLPF